MKKKKILITLISIISSVVLIGTIGSYFLFIHHYKGKEIPKESVEIKPNLDDMGKVYKQKDKDFVILNLADVQMCDLEDLFNKNIIKKEIDYLVKEVKPDLITLTGDQTWSNENLICLTSLVRWLDSYKIPYAPVFGNHDLGNQKDSAVLGTNACCDIYENGKYSLFKRGPDLGTYGNYVVNIMEDDKIFKTLYMIDSGYEDIINDAQIKWFEDNANRIKEYNNGIYPESMVFMHKPLPEYRNAYYNYDESADKNEEVFVYYSLSGSVQNGFFEKAKEVNVKNIICGHQHGNVFTLPYEGVNLTFALKTGELGGYIKDGDIYLNGATYFTLSKNNTVVSNLFVDANKYHITDPINLYD